uniref:Uncharacterized protein n=1 Tax=Candidatus Kentrum sp. FW TaxID=2126338 RepID=A0A450RVL0_9GAMM|nr:MAG: hypothetical protein BECKFW1821A_GA0114235_10031 [Candidatus Kentron sp. FW]
MRYLRSGNCCFLKKLLLLVLQRGFLLFHLLHENTPISIMALRMLGLLPCNVI